MIKKGVILLLLLLIITLPTHATSFEKQSNTDFGKFELRYHHLSMSIAKYYSWIKADVFYDFYNYNGRDFSKLDYSGLGLTIGPIVGPFAIGVGSSAGKIDNSTEISHFNSDLTFTLKLSEESNYPIHLFSYNLFQIGLKENQDYIILKQRLSSAGYPAGLVGESRKVGAEKWEWNIGISWNFGQTWIFYSNRFSCLLDFATISKSKQNYAIMWEIVL